jgi:hypothetical protein
MRPPHDPDLHGNEGAGLEKKGDALSREKIQ